MAGAMDAEDGRATREGYITWYDRYVARGYAGMPPVITGLDCYGLRCAMLHQGRLTPHTGSYSRVLFIEPGATTTLVHANVLNDALNIDAHYFAEEIVQAAEGWLDEVEDTDLYKRNYESSMQRHPNGLRPFIGGVPVIG